jgi:shikimate kinase
MSPPRHLVLVGSMGAGKSTVGASCAARLGRAVVDTDEVVAASAGATVAAVFAAEGEAGFRERERRAVADACASPEPLVIACGGGAVVDPVNRRALRRDGFVVWLRAPVDVLVRRLGDGVGRPLLAGDPRAALSRLERLRADAYREAAHAEVDAGERDVDDVAGDVLAAYAAASRDLDAGVER